MPHEDREHRARLGVHLGVRLAQRQQLPRARPLFIALCIVLGAAEQLSAEVVQRADLVAHRRRVVEARVQERRQPGEGAADGLPDYVERLDRVGAREQLLR